MSLRPVTLPAGKPLQPGLGGLVYVFQMLAEAGYSKEEQLTIVKDICSGKEVTLMVPEEWVGGV